MNDFSFDTNAYLQRLDFQASVEIGADGLQALQVAQFSAIPFENFDIHLGEGICLDPAHMFDKLVRHRRGGYCFELNGLFLMALQALGFEARALLARIQFTGNPSGRGHQVSLVTAGGKQWICDVGFGKDTPRGPVLLELDAVQELHGQPVRLTDGGKFGTMLQVFREDEWRNLYSFDMEHVCQADIDYGNHFTSTHPRSIFCMARVAVAPVKDGMVVLYNTDLTIMRNGVEEEFELPDGPGYLDALKEHFGIELDVPYAAFRPM